MALLTNNDHWLAKGIEQTMRAEIEKIVEEESAAAAQRVAARIRAGVDHVALKVLSRYTIEMNDRELIIRVDKKALDDDL